MIVALLLAALIVVWLHNNARQRVAVGQHSLGNLLTCSFRHCAFIFGPKHQRGRLPGCSALEATV